MINANKFKGNWILTTVFFKELFFHLKSFFQMFKAFWNRQSIFAKPRVKITV